jgi:hypothetical protein
MLYRREPIARMYNVAPFVVDLTVYLTALQLTGFPQEAALEETRIVAPLPGQPARDHSQPVHSMMFGPCALSLSTSSIANNCSPVRTTCDYDSK